MNVFEFWGEAVSASLVGLLERFFGFLPILFGALIVFLIGLIVASVCRHVVAKVIASLRVDRAFERTAIWRKLKESSLEVTLSAFIGEVVRWFLVLVALMAATDIMGLSQVTIFLNSVIMYLPNVIVAVIVLSIAFLLGNFTANVVSGSTRAAGVVSAAFLGTLSKWSIVIFGLLAALLQLGIAPVLVSTIFTGIIGALALAIGLAFGLGGKEEAAQVLKKIREELSNNN